jgi:very-short-patch-repair endonuclease
VSELEESLQWELESAGFNVEREFRFHPVRRWRFDFAFVPYKVAVEIQGGTWSGGAHVRGSGYQNDCAKLNEAQCLGWIVLYVTGRHIANGKALVWIRRALAERGWRDG